MAAGGALDGVLVEQVGRASEAHVAALARLLPQLSTSAAALDQAGLSAVLDAGGPVRLFAARLPGEPGLDGDGLVGFASLVVFASLTGRRALLEDVVVDEAARGRGVGAALVAAVAGAAASAGCRTLDLTSRPSREAANRLYERCGFVRRTTNVWRLEL